MNKPDRKRQERRKRLGTKSGDQTQNTDLPPMPPRHVVERSLRNIFAGGGNVRRARAQDLAFEAMEAIEQGEAARAVELAGRAVETDPACVDALRILAQASSRDKSVVIVNMRQECGRGKRRWGKHSLRKMRGISGAFTKPALTCGHGLLWRSYWPSPANGRKRCAITRECCN